MRSVFGDLIAGLAVLCALFVLVSEEGGGGSSGSGMTRMQRTADLGDLLLQAIRRQRLRSDYTKDPGTARIIEAQQALKNNGIYTGPIDGRMSLGMSEAIQAFQQSNHLNVTGIIDNDTADELGLRPKINPLDFRQSHLSSD
jgi:peptidoglycan hydrolase-like protein with peptidoglycan-binding domain